MKDSDIITRRLYNQQIAFPVLKKPEEMVSYLLAMQAQEYAMAKWSIGLRLVNSNDDAIEKAFNEGKILRTHLMRPTWHFVSPADIRWMLALTAPRVNALNAFMNRKMEVDTKIFNRSNDILIKTLEAGKQLTRTVLAAALARKKIIADGIRLSLIMMRAELDGIICSGARQGKQFTYALLDEWVAPAKAMNRDESLAAITQRYFISRGPATISDFVMWSGLTVKDAKTGIAMLGKNFKQIKTDGREYIYKDDEIKIINNPQTTFLMPDYDEYGMSYKDRTAIFDRELFDKKLKGSSPVYNRMIIVDGRIAGTWKRTLENKSAIIETVPFTTLNKKQGKALKAAIKKYSLFAGKTVEE